MTARRVVIGIGNRYRRDDGSALRVIDAVADHSPESTVILESDGEPTRLIDSWYCAPLAIVVETVRSGRAPGTVTGIAWEKLLAPSTDSLREHGSHSLGILEAIALGRALGRLPTRLRLIGIEPQDVGWGVGLSEPVERSIDRAVGIVLDYLRTRSGDGSDLYGRTSR